MASDEEMMGKVTYTAHCGLGANKCQACKRVYNLAYRLANVEKERSRKRLLEQRRRAATPSAIRAQERARYHANPAPKKAAAKAWKKAHPLAKQIDRLNYARRAARAPGRFTASDLAAQFNAQGGMCFYCVTPLAAMHIEHKTPLSRGGTNWPDNIVCACPSCNLRKHNRTAEEFLAVIHTEQVANDREAA